MGVVDADLLQPAAPESVVGETDGQRGSVAVESGRNR